MTELVIAKARSYATGKSLETDGPNDGPEIREWLLRRGIHSPAAWCAAFVCAMAEDAARELGVTLQLRRSAGALRLIDLNPDLKLDMPEVGCLVAWDHGGGLGHIGIVTGLTLVNGELAAMSAVSGNTNTTGSRDANQVCERLFNYPQAHPIYGYIRIT